MAGGDRVAVERRLAGSSVTYTHHGIDIGDGTVVHARPDDFRRPFGGGRVERIPLATFAAGRLVRVVTAPPARFSPDRVVSRALAHVGRDGYCPVVDNCEHFATWCATGHRASRQVDLVVGRIAAAAGRVAAAVTALAATGAGRRLAVRTIAGTSVRMGARTLVPAVCVGETAALIVEWRAHQRGADERASRRSGEIAGLSATAAACAIAAAASGPAGMVGGALAGAAVWVAGAAVAGAPRAASRATDR